MIPALMRVPPTPRSRSGRPMRAISDTRSCRSPSNKKLVIARLDPAIHHSLKNSFSGWMPGSSPGMTKNCCEIDMRHDGFQAIISGANPIPPGPIRMAYRRWPGAAGGRGLGPRRVPARSRVPAIEGSDGNSSATSPSLRFATKIDRRPRLLRWISPGHNKPGGYVSPERNRTTSIFPTARGQAVANRA